MYHSRSRSESSSHPLRSAGLQPSDTRPRLARLLSPQQQQQQEQQPEQEDELLPDQRTVLLHQISSTDSLAGVALKYGISLADLRRANHLWSSDSIHLRKVLYIPLDKITFDPQNDHPIRTVPLSELSFFPPPKNPQPLLEHEQPEPVRPSLTRPPLASILTALPIAPSTRDTIISRLSFDSVSSGAYSEPDDESAERHEMDEVKPRSVSEHDLLTARPRSHYHDLAPNSLPNHIRNVQLEPSPVMQLPARASRTLGPSKPKSRPKLIDIDP